MRVDQSIDLCPAEHSCVSAATAMTEHLLNAILPVTWHVTHNCLIEPRRKAAMKATGAGTLRARASGYNTVRLIL
jgi:hypothetical protein